MNTELIRITRPIMLGEYLRYMWSRPVAGRFAVENADLRNGLANVAAAEDGHGPSESLRLTRLAGRGILAVLLLSLWWIGAWTAQAQTGQCPETNVVK